MEYSKVIDHEMNTIEQALADEVYQAIQDASNGTERSAQQQAFRLGMSNIGHCQAAALFMIRQTPPSDVRDKSAAFFGTVAGAAIETQLKLTHPDWIFQEEVEFKIPSGGELGAHPDIVIPATAAVTVEEFEATAAARKLALDRIENGEEGVVVPEKVFVQGVIDLKSKDKLDVIRKYGPSRQQVWQLTGYASACIDAGLLDGSAPIWLTDTYFDRSGSQHEAYSFGWWYDPNVLNEIDDWIHDLKYATVTNEPGLKEMPREWCWNWCEYATLCRGNDTDVEGLIEDPRTLAAVDLYIQGADLERSGKKMKDIAKKDIGNNIAGSTGTHNVRSVWRNPTEVAAGVRAGYYVLDIRPVTKPKPKAKRAVKKAEAN